MLSPEIKIVIIGAGKISYSLADAIHKKGIKIVSVISRSGKSAQQLSKKYNIPHYSDSLKDIPPSANFFIISVPDNQIKKTAKEISKLKLDFKEYTFIHLSGVETVSVLNSIKVKGGSTASLHIMQTFPSKKIINLQGCYSAIETCDPETEKLLTGVSKKLKLKPFSINSEMKIYYHLAGVYASNFLVGNFFNAEKFFKISSGEQNFYKVINPIVNTSLQNVQKNGAVKSLSGPVERGDKETIHKHLSALDLLIEQNQGKREMRILKQNYIFQSLSLIELIKEREGKLVKKYIDIKNILLHHKAISK